MPRRGTSVARPGIIPLALAALALAWSAVAAADTSAAAVPGARVAAQPPDRASFLSEGPSRDAQRVADWVVSSRDNAGMPFIIVDKVQAKVFVFDSAGRLCGATLALMGMARGDDSVPGIGDRKLAAIGPGERTTPAGRFVASLGRDLHTDILWVDYNTALSLHRVIDGLPGDHRLQRLATKSNLDKRISFGCINVPARFFDDIVLKEFTGTRGIVYILPEVKPLGAVFQIALADARQR